MLLPQGIEKHRNLSTSFTRFDQLLQQQAESRFSGYIKLTFWEYEGVLVMDMGRMIEAYSEEDGARLTHDKAVVRLMEKAEEKDGTIEVFALNSEVALALAYGIQAQQYKSEQDLGNYTLGQIFDMLERESVTGYVDLKFSGAKGQGTVFYLEGIPAEAVIVSNSGKLASGDTVFQKFQSIGEMIQPGVNVFRAKNPTPLVEEDVFLIPWQHQNYLAFWKELIDYLSALVNDQFRKNRFQGIFSKVSAELADYYPFLSPQSGVVKLDDETFFVRRLLHNATFIQGMVIAINRVLKSIPVWRARRINLNKISEDVRQLANRYEIELSQLDPQKLVGQVFRGIKV
ncbi:MAG: hypothetical protein AAFP70_06855 [Calditrichota bacterium]